jgi:hypothetical protein
MLKTELAIGAILVERYARLIIRKDHRWRVGEDARIPHLETEFFAPVLNLEINTHGQIRVGLPLANLQPINTAFQVC